MTLQQFKHFNNIIGWLMFFIAATVYTQTMESTTSLWDCGEFISSAYKQQVVHPPGAAMFLMIGRLFTLLAGGNTDIVALSMNFMSAICTGLAILFLFWITTHLARRALVGYSTDDLPKSQAITILGAGIIAALSATFADSIWFSAVEGEVYAMSLTFTALVFWVMMKWDEHADEPYADRWLLLLAFVVGVSIFVHWLNLLCIPAMSFIYYFRRYTATWRGIILTFLTSIVILWFIYDFVIVRLVDIAASIEMVMVNDFGLPFNSGVVLFILLLGGGLALGINYAHKKTKVTLYNALTGIVLILIGYSAIATTVIRSNAEPNIDMNSPRDIVSLSAYLKREQYGSRPFLTGYYYTAEPSDVVELGKKYARVGDRYEVVGSKIDYTYAGKEILFPRIWDSSHRADYERWLNKKGEPNFADNISFFFRYQIGHMYFRYLFWNFVGRQNDEQGMGDSKDGNWLSGINFLDSFRLGPQSNLPDDIKNHPARNTYFFLPFLLGLFGLVFHFFNDKRRAVVVFLLFFFCGIAIIIQGNSPPVEPRERDYIFAGSFLAFTIWIGLGVVGLYDVLREKADKNVLIAYLLPAACLLAPFLMGFYGWDDHDRSGRFAARDFAANYLNSCAPNSIIFTQGDNDTYPLWYAQEVEGIRRDVRVVNLSLLGVDWYIEQLRRKVNDADPVPMTMKPEHVRGTRRDVVYYMGDEKSPEAPMELRDMMSFIADDKRSLAPTKDQINYFPSKSLRFTVNKEKLLASGAIAPEDMDKVEPVMEWNIGKKNALYKNDLMVLDIIAANNWEKPIYFAISVAPSSYLGLEKYFQLEGLAYRLVPVSAIADGKRGPGSTGRVNPDIMYNNLMHRFKFGRINNPDVHVDADLQRMVFNFRNNYGRLAESLILRGDKQRAVEVLDRSLELMPDHSAPYNVYMFNTIEAYYDAGAYEKGNKLAEAIADKSLQMINYQRKLPGKLARSYEQDADMGEYFIRSFIAKAKQVNQNDFAAKLEAKLKEAGLGGM